MNKKKLIKAEIERDALIQMYKAGFLDGYNENLDKYKRFTKAIQKKCYKAFNFRFVERLNKEKQKNDPK